MDFLEILAIIVLILTVLAAIVYVTRRFWKKYWKRFRGIQDPEPPIPAAVFEPPWYNTQQDTIQLNTIPIQLPIITPRRESRAGIQRPASTGNTNRSRSSIVPIVPLPDETNSYAHDWFNNETRYQNINRSNIHYLSQIGSGWFGKVIEANVQNLKPFHESTHAIVKQLSDDASDRDAIRFLHEARVYRDGNHTSILKLLGYSIERLPYLLILENWPLGDLKSYLRNRVVETDEDGNQILDFSILMRMATEIARALEFMGGLDFVHSDLAARNCLVANTAGKVILGDYGLGPSHYREDYYWSSITCIPIRWSAPETMNVTMNTIITTKITQKSNVWSYGVLLWEILELGKQPYPTLSDEDVLDQVITSKTYILERPLNSLIHDQVIDEIYTKVLIPCLNYDPATRPTISTVLTALSGE